MEGLNVTHTSILVRNFHSNILKRMQYYMKLTRPNASNIGAIGWATAPPPSKSQV